MKKIFLILIVSLFSVTVSYSLERDKLDSFIELHKNNHALKLYTELNGDPAGINEWLSSNYLTNKEKAVLLYLYGWSASRSGHIGDGIRRLEQADDFSRSHGIDFISLAALRDLLYLNNLTGYFSSNSEIAIRLLELEKRSDSLEAEAAAIGLLLSVPVMETASDKKCSPPASFVIRKTEIDGKIRFRLISEKLYADVDEARNAVRQLNRSAELKMDFAVVPVPYGWRIIAGSFSDQRNAVRLLEMWVQTDPKIVK